MTTLNRRALLGGTAAALAAAATQTGARAQPATFAGRNIEFMIPFAEAGGSDIWARFITPFIARHLPGNPTVFVRNVPGGGSITGANEFAQRVRPDGMTLFGASASTQLPFLLGDRRVRFDFRDWVPVLISPFGGVFYAHSRTGISSTDQIAQLRGQELVFPGQTVTGLDVVPVLAMHMLGMNVRYVWGMRGRGEARLALERGDASVDHQTTPAFLTQVMPMVREGNAVPLFSYGVVDAAGRVVRDPSFPEIPTFEEVYERVHGRAPDGVIYDAYRACSVAAFAAQKPAVLKRDTPAPVIAAWRAAMESMVRDPELVSTGGDVLGVYEQAVGEAADTLYRLATNISDDARRFVQEFLTQNHNVRF